VFIAPAVAGDAVYIGSCSGVFYAFESSTGTVLWQHDTKTDGPSAQFHGDALVTEELVIVGSDARPVAQLYAFERAGGAVRWKHAFPFGVMVDLKRFGNSVLVASVNSEVAAFDISTGEVLWWSPSGLETSPQSPPVDPVLADGSYYVAWRTGHLDAYDATTGTLSWRRELPATPNSSLVTVDDDLVLGTMAGTLLSLGRSSGDVLAELPLGGYIYGELVPTADCILALVAPPEGERAPGHSLVCAAPDLSGVRWRHTSEVPGSFGTFDPLVVGDLVIVGPKGELQAVSMTDGALLWTRPIDGLPRGLANSGSTLYVGTIGGLVLALPWAP